MNANQALDLFGGSTKQKKIIAVHSHRSEKLVTYFGLQVCQSMSNHTSAVSQNLQ